MIDKDRLINFFGVKFNSEIQVISVMKNNTIEINNVNIAIHYNLKFDGFYETTDFVRNKFGLSNK